MDLIKCVISASELTFEWYKNDRLVDDNSSGDWWAEGEFVVGGDQGQIFIMAAEHNHLGYYHCLAVNEFGTAKSEVIKASTSSVIHPKVLLLFTLKSLICFSKNPHPKKNCLNQYLTAKLMMFVSGPQVFQEKKRLRLSLYKTH